jgi:hypothetical protein
MPTNASINTYITDYELYHIYRKMYEEKRLGYYWFARGSRPWIRMNQIKNRITDKRYIKRGEKG